MKSIVTMCPPAGKKPRVQALRCRADLLLHCIPPPVSIHLLPLCYARRWRPHLPQATAGS